MIKVIMFRPRKNLHLTLRSRQRLQAVEAFGELFSAGIVFKNVKWGI